MKKNFPEIWKTPHYANQFIELKNIISCVQPCLDLDYEIFTKTNSDDFFSLPFSPNIFPDDLFNVQNIHKFTFLSIPNQMIDFPFNLYMNRMFYNSHLGERILNKDKTQIEIKRLVHLKNHGTINLKHFYKSGVSMGLKKSHVNAMFEYFNQCFKGKFKLKNIEVFLNSDNISLKSISSFLSNISTPNLGSIRIGINLNLSNLNDVDLLIEHIAERIFENKQNNLEIFSFFFETNIMIKNDLFENISKILLELQSSLTCFKFFISGDLINDFKENKFASALEKILPNLLLFSLGVSSWNQMDYETIKILFFTFKTKIGKKMISFSIYFRSMNLQLEKPFCHIYEILTTNHKLKNIEIILRGNYLKNLKLFKKLIKNKVKNNSQKTSENLYFKSFLKVIE